MSRSSITPASTFEFFAGAAFDTNVAYTSAFGGSNIRLCQTSISVDVVLLKARDADGVRDRFQ